MTPKIKKLADSGCNVKLALSLHAATQKKRAEIMPVAKTFGLKKLMEAVEYYVSTTGQPLAKHAPPKGKEGAPKRGMGVSEHDYLTIMHANGWQWDERVCTKNKGVYSTVITNIQAGYLTEICNKADAFRFGTVNYDWYINEARKLII